MLWFETHRAAVGLPAGAAYNSNRQWNERHSVLLRLGHPAGPVGLGEATPLPGYCPDDVDAALSDLEGLTSRVIEPAVASHTPKEALEQLGPLLDGFCPSARFAVESAVLDVGAQLNGVPLRAWLRSLFAEGVINTSPTDAGVDNLADDHSAVAGDARTSRGALFDTGQHFRSDAQGFVSCRHIDLCAAAPFRGLLPGPYKAKVGLDMTTELAVLAQRPREVTSLRLDANGAFSGSELDTVLSQYAESEPEFMEEPTLLQHLGRPRKLPLPIAFDESLLGLAGDRALSAQVVAWCEIGQVAAFVVKPMRLGGISPLLHVWRLAQTYGLPLIVSHLHDGSVAARVYRELALCLGTRRYAMGLYPHASLELWRDVPSDARTSRGRRF